VLALQGEGSVVSTLIVPAVFEKPDQADVTWQQKD
jgi:hypothetical protein